MMSWWRTRRPTIAPCGLTPALLPILVALSLPALFACAGEERPAPVRTVLFAVDGLL